MAKDYIWGDTRLREEYNKHIDVTPLAETWECSTHPDGPSRVAKVLGPGPGNKWSDKMKKLCAIDTKATIEDTDGNPKISR